MPYASSPIDDEGVYFEDDGGDGTPVVVLGGFLDPIDLVRRAPLARAMAGAPDGFRLLFVDHRGHGRSGKPHDPAAYTMSIRVADVTAAMDEARIDRAAVVGLSWGGRLGLGIAEHARNASGRSWLSASSRTRSIPKDRSHGSSQRR